MTISESGRELDAAVAEEVMGVCVHSWEDVPYKPDICSECGDDKNGGRGDYSTERCTKCSAVRSGLSCGRPQVFPYSSSWDAAREVVEKLQEDRRVRMYLSTDIDNRWTCTIEKHEAGDGIKAATLPEAICRAALAWVRSTTGPKVQKGEGV